MSKQKLLKAYPFLKEVDSFSIQAALGLYKVRPHWLNYAYVVKWEDNKYWEIKIESSFDNRHLKLNSNNNRLTVYPCNWAHFHYGVSEKYPTMPDLFHYIFEFIDGFCREEWVIAYGSNKKGWRITTTVPINEIHELHPDKFHYLYSWLGTYDKNLGE